jgi:hypothetical protein
MRYAEWTRSFSIDRVRISVGVFSPWAVLFIAFESSPVA